MKTKIFIRGLALALVADFCFGGGGEEKPGGEAGMYGGTLTIAYAATKGDPASPAQQDAQVGALANWTATVQEHLILGDHEQWGKWGTASFPSRSATTFPIDTSEGFCSTAGK